MKHNHRDQNFRGAVQKARPKSFHPTANAEVLDDSRAEAEAPRATGNGGGAETLGNRERLASGEVSQRNKQPLNTIAAVWPTPSP